jgi:hypothetical protein
MNRMLGFAANAGIARSRDRIKVFIGTGVAWHIADHEST